MPWPSRLGDGSRWELSPETVSLPGVAPLLMQATGPLGPGGSPCQGSCPQGYEGARQEPLAIVKATRLGEITLNKSWSSRMGVCREASSLTQEKLHAKKAQR